MPEKHSGIYLPDGSFDFSGGVDSSKVKTVASDLNPHGLKRNQLAWLYNGSCRNGSIRPRAGWKKILKISESAKWQGGFLYEPDGANPYLVCQISGILYSVLLESPYTVTDLTGGNAALQNPADAEMVFFCQGENWLVIQAGDYYTNPNPTLPLFWNGTTLRRSIGIINPAPQQIPGQNEIPAATCMDYYGGRIWYAQARQYAAGDIVGGPSGTSQERFRDAILSVTENPLCFGGDGFTVPTNAGNIRALKHSASLNAPLGQGEFYIFTRKAVYSMAVPTTRTDWINADANNQPTQKLVQLNNGAVGDRCVVPINGDLFYISFDPAIRTLITATRYFEQWGNTPISQNEERLLKASNRALMRFSSGIEFDNRIYFTALPRMATDGINVIHPGIAPLDFDIVTNLEDKTAPVWEGALSGIQILQLFSGDFGGLPRAFAAMVSKDDQSLNVWEITSGETTEDGDKRVGWSVEWPAFNWSNVNMEFKLKHLMGGEIWVDSLSGTADIDVFYRPDSETCWWWWFHTQICAARDCGEVDPPFECYPNETFGLGYRHPLVLPAPKGVCDSMGIRPSTIGYQFQMRLDIKGSLRITGIMLYATPHAESAYRGLVCAPGIPSGMAKLPNPME